VLDVITLTIEMGADMNDVVKLKEYKDG